MVRLLVSEKAAEISDKAAEISEKAAKISEKVAEIGGSTKRKCPSRHLPPIDSFDVFVKDTSHRTFYMAPYLRLMENKTEKSHCNRQVLS